MDDRERDRYDRQARTIGREAMQKILASKTLIVGMGGLGAEIAKNLVLMGAKNLTLYDPKPVTWMDLSSQFLLFSPEDGTSDGNGSSSSSGDATSAVVVEQELIGQNRAKQSLRYLSLLNEYSDVQVYTGELDESFLKQFSVVVFTDDHICQLVSLNEICRRNGVKFIAAESRGLFGSVFVDFGDSFEVLDTDGEQPSSGVVVNIESDDSGVLVVDTKDEGNVKPHGLNDDDIVILRGIEGAVELNEREFVIKRVDPFKFSINDIHASKCKAYTSGGHYFQVKKPVTLHFKSLSDSLKDPNCDFFYDYAKMDYPPLLHTCMITLADFNTKNGRLPAPRNEKDAEEMLQIAKQNFNREELSDLETDLIKNLSYTSRGQLNPMAAVLGGLAAQEVQKATTQKFSPIHQWFHFESCLSLPKFDNDVSEEEFQPMDCRYDGQIVVFGRKYQRKLENQTSFLVGAGALGCEFLKNFALMGTACGPRGKLIVTDLDSIENSNLSRQFLFRKEHIGKMKSVVGAEAARCMNAHLNVEALQDRVGPETENVFNEKFWSSLDFVTNALDNIEARKYVDSKCIFFRKPLLESGTLGTKANVQVIYPDVTESYGSQSDPEQNVFPECTIHFFPNVIQHTITWAKSVFKSSLNDNVEVVNEFISNSQSFMTGEKGNNILALETVYDYLVRNKPLSFLDCVSWARIKFEELFNWGIKNIILTYPADKQSASGGMFWSGNKRCPTPISFDPEDETHMMFIEAASILYSNLYGITSNLADLKDIVQQVTVPQYVPNPIADTTKGENEKSEEKPKEDESVSDDSQAKRREEYIEHLKTNILAKCKTSDQPKFIPIEFEKDSDTNFHVEFMTSCSNLRARSYKIPEVDKWVTKGIAGNIIPAMITTTALVTGLVSLELYKILEKKTIEELRCSYLNIAIPFITMSEPAPAKKEIANRYTIWDTIEIDEKTDLTLHELLQRISSGTQYQVLSVTYYGVVLYTCFMPRDKLEKRNTVPVSKLIEKLTKEKLDKTQTVLSLQVMVMDLSEQGSAPFNLPRVRYHFKSSDKLSPKELALAKKRALLAKKRSEASE